MLQRVAIAPAQILGQTITLTPEQSHYLGRVLRLRRGDRFIALTESGEWWLAEISILFNPSSDENLSAAKLLEIIPVSNELELPITLLIALPKSGMDDIVRQATELGAARIIPVLSDRTLLKPSAQKLNRWRRIAQEAAEQSERQVVPKIDDPRTWIKALEMFQTERHTRYLCAARRPAPHLLLLLLSEPPVNPILLAIGPEGGWTDAEIEGAIMAGYQVVSLGSRILRSTTAPIAALGLISAVVEGVTNRDK
jgi:16S rRNA (uracil1498-N3)-methyltransferase